MAEVQRVLDEIGAADVPQMLVFNKLDRLDADQRPRSLRDAFEARRRLRAARLRQRARPARAWRCCASGSAAAVDASGASGLNATAPAASAADADPAEDDPSDEGECALHRHLSFAA